MARLILHPGRGDEQVFELRVGTTTIGRAPDNGIPVPHVSLSRRHAEVEVAEGGAPVFLSDLGSKNGTWVEKRRIQRVELQPGASIICGEVELTFAAEGAPSAPEREAGTSLEPTLLSKVEDHFAGSRLQGPLGRIGRAPDAGSTATVAAAPSRVETLLRVSQLLSSPGPIGTLLEKILGLAFELLDVDRGAILLLDAQGRLEPRVVRSSRPQPPGEKLWSQHIVDFVRDRGVAALFADARRDARLDDAGSVLAQSICSSMCAPLKPRDEVIGVLYVDNRSATNRFGADDLDVLAGFANQAAIAIDNARLYARLEDEAVLRNSLLRFFPPTTIARLMDTSSSGLELIEAEVTALFVDISNFSEMAAEMAPRAVVELLNDYLPVMTEIVFRHGGTLEKYIGDAMLAVWGAPFAHPDDADHAVAAACEMQRAQRRLNATWAAQGRRELHLHIGLNTGVVAAGNIGSEQYIQYATIGDATNMASRVCTAARADEVLVTDATLKRLGTAHTHAEPLPPVTVKGREAPLALYRVRWDESG